MNNSLKLEAIKLRKQGLSIRKIEGRLNISRSTLSGWFRNILLTQKQKEALSKDWQKALIKARKKAVFWHNAQKQARLELARQEASKTFSKLPLKNINVLELALAMLYLGEGSKRNPETALASSDPSILKFFLASLNKIYDIDTQKVRCELYLRADQNQNEIKQFWSKELNMPLECFKQTNIDQRTRGSKTYANYKGVCNIRCSHVAIQRKLLYLSEAFIKHVQKRYGRLAQW